MDWWKWLLAAAAAIVTIGSAASYIKKWITPVLNIKSCVENLEEHDAADMKRFKKLDEQWEKRETEWAEEREHQRISNQAIFKALDAIMSHEIDGNSTDKLREARKELINYIIEIADCESRKNRSKRAR